MYEKKPICKKCKSQCKDQVDANPTWFGKWVGNEFKEAICIDCWKKGERWENELQRG